MTRSELVRILKEKHGGFFIKDINVVVDVVLEEMSAALANGDRVELRGFGSFSIRNRKARKARNPKTGEIIDLASRNSIYFRAGKDLRDRINKN